MSKNYIKIIFFILALQHHITYQPLVMHRYRIKNNRIPLSYFHTVMQQRDLFAQNFVTL